VKLEQDAAALVNHTIEGWQNTLASVLDSDDDIDTGMCVYAYAYVCVCLCVCVYTCVMVAIICVLCTLHTTLTPHSHPTPPNLVTLHQVPLERRGVRYTSMRRVRSSTSAVPNDFECAGSVALSLEGAAARTGHTRFECVCVCVCVSMYERECESVCLCVSVCVWSVLDRLPDCLSTRHAMFERGFVCIYVCMREYVCIYVCMGECM
jgi:hypothetical protein